MKRVTRVRNLRNGERYQYGTRGFYTTATGERFSLTGPCAGMIAHLANLDTVEEQFDFLCFSILWENLYHIDKGIVSGKASPAGARYMKLREQVAENPWIGSAKNVVPIDMLLYESELFDDKEDLRLDTVEKIFREMSTHEYVLHGYMLKNDRNIGDDILDKLQGLDPLVFEIVVAELLKAMGYGEYSLTSKSVDGGIDIILSEDPLGLHKIYVQVKRYAKRNQVTKREMQNFVGALELADGDKGIFVTTSKYYRDAYAVRESTKKNIALIDGQQLCSLMVNYRLGVKEGASIGKLSIDNNYFTKLASQSQKRLAPITGRTDVWADYDPSLYRSILDL